MKYKCWLLSTTMSPGTRSLQYPASDDATLSDSVCYPVTAHATLIRLYVTLLHTAIYLHSQTKQASGDTHSPAFEYTSFLFKNTPCPGLCNGSCRPKYFEVNQGQQMQTLQYDMITDIPIP